MATDKYLAAAIGDYGNCQMCVKNCKDAAVAIIHGEAHTPLAKEECTCEN